MSSFVTGLARLRCSEHGCNVSGVGFRGLGFRVFQGVLRRTYGITSPGLTGLGFGYARNRVSG